MGAGMTENSTYLQEDGQQDDEDGDHDEHRDEVEGDLVGLLALQADSPVMTGEVQHGK